MYPNLDFWFENIPSGNPGPSKMVANLKDAQAFLPDADAPLLDLSDFRPDLPHILKISG
jgi:hypothetical protein